MKLILVKYLKNKLFTSLSLEFLHSSARKALPMHVVNRLFFSHISLFPAMPGELSPDQCF